MRRDIGGWTVRWDAGKAEEFVRAGVWANKTVAHHLAERLRDDPNHACVIEGDRVTTLREIDDESERLARALVHRGYKPGETISFQLPNWREAVVIGLAAAKAGLVLGPITPIYRDAEIGFMLRDSRSRLLFVPHEFRNVDYLAMARRVRETLGLDLEIVCVRGGDGASATYDTLIAEGAKPAPLPGADPNAVKLVMYTSGTTGRAKGVLHSHNSLQSENWMRQQHLGVGPHDILYNPSTVTHVTGALYSLCMPFTLGITTILADTWDPGAAVATMRDRRATAMIAATIFLEGLLAEAKKQDEHLPDMRFYLCGGAQVRPELIREATAFFYNCAFSRIYGATEVPNITGGINTRANAELGATTDGQIFGCEARVVDAVTGAPLPTGSEGEIIARGPQMLIGYTHPEDAEQAIDAEGYFHMGDLGQIVHDDFIVITGRKKDIIIRAGENISPKEVEDVLGGHPAIAEIAIVAMPNPRTGEMACAFVVLHREHSIDLSDMAAFLIAAGIAKQKIPEHLEIVADLPRTAIGKVRKDLLRDRARAIAAARTP
ncbi:MAG: AMP-binding protein [Hyphomonadaceae bacterium]|nr:AMP-binding protein [Hyphomonadaceae bacterium]